MLVTKICAHIKRKIKQIIIFIMFFFVVAVPIQFLYCVVFLLLTWFLEYQIMIIIIFSNWNHCWLEESWVDSISKLENLFFVIIFLMNFPRKKNLHFSLVSSSVFWSFAILGFFTLIPEPYTFRLCTRYTVHIEITRIL